MIVAENATDPQAVSHKGAIGLMQFMPDTWDELGTRHDLGPDPFAPADNILAGTAYLRQMLDRYGSNALMLAAYNAGSGRIDEHLATGRALPSETVDYVAKLSPVLTPAHDPSAPSPFPVGARDRRSATLFVPIGSSFSTNSERSAAPFARAERTMQQEERAPSKPIHATSGHQLFVQPNTQRRR